ncbi:MAG TPA: SAM-dependent methyltransferase [Acidobacteria bacterium]|nr:SAM-dependent methyltransferase [Acidobacteriota bacterium]
MAKNDLTDLSTETALAAVAATLGARGVAGWSAPEEALVAEAPPVAPDLLHRIRAAIQGGEDPLGEAFCRLRNPAVRRPLGATYTPCAIVSSMVDWAAGQGSPVRVVDPGAGSGRFLLKAAHRFPAAELLGIEIDPLAALLVRANLAVAGAAERARVLLADYRSTVLPRADGPTLYIGNPPYVRHHLIPHEWKQWLTREASRRGYRCSQLAGLHAYFFLTTALQASDGDYGTFITAAEWLDVNYGRLVRDLFLDRLGGTGVLLIEPAASPFPDAAATAAITTFRINARPSVIRLRRVEALDRLANPAEGRGVRRERLESEERWSHLTRRADALPSDFVELGELFRVHRGQVTGANRVWIAGPHSRGLPESVLFPSITKARELLAAGLVLTDAEGLRRVIDLPPDLAVLAPAERKAAERFLKLAKAAGADQSYIARNRKAWWSVGLKTPAPILATYMARRPPAFVRNAANARHINIAHGLYPREAWPEQILTAVVKFLSGNISRAAGRTYAGGLTKFEPREMERIPVPSPSTLAEMA